MDTQDIKSAIRKGYAWPGGYEFFAITSDGNILCTRCLRKNYRQIAYSMRNNLRNEWKIEAIDNSSNLESGDFVREHPDQYSLSCCEECAYELNP